ncbi:hypothetical protein ACUM5Y_12410 [Marinomonas dokdonensis]|uniref:hypothetical protein n=1 Tax=Marinomonas dokdonensis TaxID=328224 RepID=UPI0040558054
MHRDDDVEIPSLVLDQDEVSDRRPAGATTPAPKRRLNPAPAKPVQATAKPQKTSLAGVYFLLFLILGASGGAAFWLWQQNTQLRNELYGAKSEIQNLDHQLLAADVSANKQGETLEETLKTHDSEIRKLWAVAYDRNRGAIADNLAAIKALDSKLAATRDSLSTQSKRIAIQADVFNDVEEGYNKLLPAVAKVEEEFNGVKAEMTELKSTVESQSQTVGRNEQGITALTGKVEAQTLSLEQVAQELASLKTQLDKIESTPVESNTTELTAITSQLAKHQEAIDSSDAFRKQVNAELIRLRQQANEFLLQQRLDAEN